MDWFLYDIGLRHERVKSYYSHLRIFVKKGYDFFMVVKFTHYW